MKTYKTSEIARLAGVHPNTVRLYEEWGILPRAKRLQNGYRVFTEFHVSQIRLCRTALRGEVLQNGLRKLALQILHTSAAGEIESAVGLAGQYMERIKQEKKHAEEALALAEHKFCTPLREQEDSLLTRRQTADWLQVTPDTLRNWELNGLLRVKRKANGYRVYNAGDLARLEIIRALRSANYSLNAILRMMSQVENSSCPNFKKSIDTPSAAEDIVTACDHLLTALDEIFKDVQSMLRQLEEMRKNF